MQAWFCRHRRDLLLVLILLVAAGIASLLMGILRTDGMQIAVTVGGTEIVRLPLDTDTEYRIETEQGYNLLVIEDGRALIREADCPGRQCTHTSVSRTGESILCLPHGVSVHVLDESDGIDGTVR